MGGLLMIVLASLLTIGSSCTVPYVAVGDQCLLFLSTLTLDHQSSADICESLNGNAARVNESEQLRSLVEYIQGDVTLQNSYWIDGSEIQREWLYSDGAAIPMGTPFWATYYDNATGYGQQPIVSNVESCLALVPGSYYYFSSNSCDEKMSPLCEEVSGTSHSVGSTSSCGGSLTSFSGEITSPNYPDAYPVQSDCVWTITRGVDSIIRMTVNDVDIHNDNGINQYLSIRDGPGSNSSELGHYYGHNTVTPVTLVTSGNQAWVSFQSLNSGGYKGFSMSYSTVWKGDCNINYNSSTGSVRSPLYPEGYSPNLDCTWSLTVDDGYYIALTVFDFDTENNDIVQIRDGASNDASLIDELSGFVETGYEITSTNNHLSISFKTDDSTNGAGFAFMWTAKEICPTPYLNVGQMCLHFIFNSLTYGQSGIACEESSGKLAAIDHSQDLRDLYVYLQNKGIADTSFWIGGSDQEDEGLWKWTDGTLVPRGTPFWGTTGSYSEVQEPDGGETENCLLLQSEGMHFFRDARCDTMARAICMHSS